MPRGRHSRDAELFGTKAVPRLRTAVADLSWLLGRGYAEVSATKLVGDRHQLRARQRIAIRRSSAADEAVADRASRRQRLDAIADQTVWVDGFNALITVESVSAGGVGLVGRDAALRDLASVHGSYRRGKQTEAAILLIGEALMAAAPAKVRFLLDRPVSNSGRLRGWLMEQANERGWPWEIELSMNPDRELVDKTGVVASSDSWILDRCGPWIDLPAAVVRRSLPEAWLVDLSHGGGDDVGASSS